MEIRNRLRKIALTVVIVTAMTAVAHGQISYTGGAYTQNFDSMGSTGTNTPSGWFTGTGSGAAVTGTTVVAGTGSSSTAASYNFGVLGVNALTDRALGSVASGSTQRDGEVHFTNNLGFNITQFTISYDGEQWRNGGPSAVANTLALQLSTDGLTWTPLGSAFNFVSPINSGAAGPLDGNAAANRITAIGGTYTPLLPIVNGAVFYFRWADLDDSGNDHGLALDNFVFSAIPEPSVSLLLGVGLLLCGLRFRRGHKSS